MDKHLRIILNDRLVESDLPSGTTVLDFVRSEHGLVGTKEGCREGDCGACVVLVGSLKDDELRYKAMTSCLVPVGDLAGCHLVTIEGLNQSTLSPVQQAIVDAGATQCGFCTPGIVVSLTGSLIESERFDVADAITAVEGNICRCTGYDSIRQAIEHVCNELRDRVDPGEDRIAALVREGVLPATFALIADRLRDLERHTPRPRPSVPDRHVVAGGTDLYVQRLHDFTDLNPTLLMGCGLSGIRTEGAHVVLGATTTHEQVRRSKLMQELIPNLRRFTDLVSSEPIRQRATLGGNVANASPIGDFTVMLLALDTEIGLVRGAERRTMPLSKLFKGYKDLDLREGEIIEWFRFHAQTRPLVFNFEKVSKRTRLDIASVNSALRVTARDGVIIDAHMAAGGVAPVPLYLERSSALLRGREITVELALEVAAVADEEVAPISDVRGTAEYKRLLLRQLIFAHFDELFGFGEELVAEVLP